MDYTSAFNDINRVAIRYKWSLNRQIKRLKWKEIEIKLVLIDGFVIFCPMAEAQQNPNARALLRSNHYRYKMDGGDFIGLEDFFRQAMGCSAVKSEPVATIEPEPVAKFSIFDIPVHCVVIGSGIKPEPVATIEPEPEPVAVEPEPVAIEPEPIALSNEPVAFVDEFGQAKCSLTVSSRHFLVWRSQSGCSINVLSWIGKKPKAGPRSPSGLGKSFTTWGEIESAYKTLRPFVPAIAKAIDTLALPEPVAIEPEPESVAVVEPEPIALYDNRALEIATDKLKNRIAEHSTETLCMVWESMDMRSTANNPNREDCAIVRQFIFEELERRDPQAMSNWLECEDFELDDKPSHFFCPSAGNQQHMKTLTVKQPITPDEPIALSDEPVAAPNPVVIQRDLFGKITSVRSLTPKPAIAQLALF